MIGDISDQELFNTRMLEDFLNKHTNLFKDRMAVMVGQCSMCGAKRLIYCHDIMNGMSRCYDCDSKFVVDKELENGTNKDIRTKAYLAGEGYMTIEKQFEAFVSQREAKGNPSFEDDF